MSDEKPDMSYLIEGSSLGTEGARLLRRRAATADVASVVEAASAQQDPLDALVEDAVHQEHHALDALLRRINPLVVRYCRARLGRQEGMFTLADDVAQEVGLAVLKALPHFREQGRPFMAFVFGIAAHKVADAHRAAARNRSDPVPDVPDGRCRSTVPSSGFCRPSWRAGWAGCSTRCPTSSATSSSCGSWSGCRPRRPRK